MEVVVSGDRATDPENPENSVQDEQAHGLGSRLIARLFSIVRKCAPVFEGAQSGSPFPGLLNVEPGADEAPTDAIQWEDEYE